ncbi:cAMP-binding domain of CRP or a regulatory subunit of cAMP-dependent protein kinases [Ekhidna lutea]|uniref:cAMP-binding domain of CRP or a regulatory subunit of cAMP-dependent protein kinases n=1 Tax=Ekhidna lutea TaxID=447679 RepID=A0A239HD60_EKHLU|nr:Crp/Fnr family transcriptional regulator [Ekhidna lutea]SNS78184.1 cAMP-binding domain of CRP or a regulatory subunit of cAMP-dependent protein kinases [Ekhidna lutea]
MEFESLINYLNQHIDLSSHEVSILKDQAKIRTYLKGQYIVQQGDICKYENFVISGCAKTFFMDKDGNEHVVMFALENWWTADLGSFISQEPADYNVQCLEKTTVIQFTPEALEHLYSEIPQLERFMRIIIQKAFVASQKRIVRNHSLSAKDRYLLFREQYPEIEQRVPQYLIASYLGITKQFLSKIRAELVGS